MPDRAVLFYDSDCRFCRAAVVTVRTLDHRHCLAMLPFADPSADAMLASVHAGLRESSIHVVRTDGNVVSAGDAFIELFRVLPWGDQVVAGIHRAAPLRRAFRAGYTFVAGRRGAFSRMVPDCRAPYDPPTES